MQETILLPSREDVLMLHDLILSVSPGRQGILHSQYIDAALERPYSRMQYEGVDIHSVVASLVDSFARNHAFNDGNKRTALMCGIYTYAINGIFLDFSDEMNNEFESLVLKVVREKPTIDQITADLSTLVEIHSQSSIEKFFTSFLKFFGIN